LLAGMRANHGAVRFRDALKVAQHFFGKPRRSGSHHVFKMPGEPRINLQEDGKDAKHYQILQLLAAVDRIDLNEWTDDDG
jgi:hypothetical protein